MGFLNSFLNQTATLYDIDTTQTTSTGQPIETLVLKKTNVPIFFSPHPSMVYKIVQAGGVKIGDFTAIMEQPIQTNQVLKIGVTNYRIVSAVEVKFKVRQLAFVAHLEYL